MTMMPESPDRRSVAPTVAHRDAPPSILPPPLLPLSERALRLARRGRSFAREEDGGMIFWSLATFLGLFSAVGLGLTTQIFETHRAHLQNTLDRAVLAATD